MAFDVAKILANLILTVFATYGLEATEPHKPRAEQRGEGVRGEGKERWEKGQTALRQRSRTSPGLSRGVRGSGGGGRVMGGGAEG